MSLTVRRLSALEILDSRVRPTVSVEAELSDGSAAWAQVPSGASTGRHEALELRDADPARFAGKGVLQACANVEEVIAPALTGMDAEAQAAIDGRMIELDGTENKSKLGANAILGVSCAVARAVAEDPVAKEIIELAAKLAPAPFFIILAKFASHLDERLDQAGLPNSGFSGDHQNGTGPVVLERT